MQYKCFFIVFFFPLGILAQNGGQSTFSFVNIEHSPRVEAMGGNLISIFDNDVSLSQTAPSLLNPQMHNELAFTFGDYFADINLFSFSYAMEIKSIGVIGVSLKAINYGDFDRNDAFGYNQGVFSANDQMLTFGIGKKVREKLFLGVNLNFLNSVYDTYTSFALSSNISSTYFHSDKMFCATLLFKNIGRQLHAYLSEKEPLPFEVQCAISKELKHLPFRYHLTYNNINEFDIKSPYKLTNQTNIETGQLELKSESIAKTFLRHLIIGGEFNPFRKSLFIRGGFNFQRRFDLSTVTRPAMVGFSWGIGFRVYKYYFDYSRSSYHLSGISNSFSITTNLRSFGLQ
ncbi:MAG: type IX secretion system protein PorQ [Bacteroidota bacterium]|nr:type IX secretion system protein PorQ [Bacteroidota bacterium]